MSALDYKLESHIGCPHPCPCPSLPMPMGFGWAWLRYYCSWVGISRCWWSWFGYGCKFEGNVGLYFIPTMSTRCSIVPVEGTEHGKRKTKSEFTWGPKSHSCPVTGALHGSKRRLSMGHGCTPVTWPKNSFGFSWDEAIRSGWMSVIGWFCSSICSAILMASFALERF